MNRLLAWYDRRRGGRAVLVSWLVSRTLTLLLLAVAERTVVGDVFYYHRKIQALFSVGLDRTLNEYPTPVVWILWLPYGVTWGSRVGYLVAFMVFMLALDGLFTLVLYRTGGRRHDQAIDFWLLFVFLVGPLAYLRFDLIPAVLAGGALLAARRRPWLAGALTALGAAIKLWPALLVGALLPNRATRRPTAVGFVAAGTGLAVLSLILGGWSRLISPLIWQSGRGLQIESIWATPLMVTRVAHPSSWPIAMSKYQAYEISGSGVSSWVLISNLVTVAGLAVIIALFVRAFRACGSTPITVGFLMVATIAIMTVTNKTLSPQYLLWLGGPIAGMLLLRPGASETEVRVVNRIAVQALGLALLTHLVFPLLYDGLRGLQGNVMLVVSTVVTALRNLALVIFTVEACRYAWTLLGARTAQPVAAGPV